MELEAATRALAVRIEARQQNGAAIRAARAGDRADHPRRSRANLFLARATLGRPVLLFLRLIAVHIAPLPILALQGDLQGGSINHTPNSSAQQEKSEAIVQNGSLSVPARGSETCFAVSGSRITEGRFLADAVRGCEESAQDCFGNRQLILSHGAKLVARIPAQEGPAARNFSAGPRSPESPQRPDSHCALRPPWLPASP